MRGVGVIGEVVGDEEMEETMTMRGSFGDEFFRSMKLPTPRSLSVR